MDDLNHDGFRTLVDLNIMLKNWSDELAEVNTQMKLNWGIKTNKKAIFVCNRGGISTNPGTILNPVKTLAQAHALASDGDTIFIRGQTNFNEHYFDETEISKKLIITKYANENPVLDGTKSISELKFDSSTIWETETKTIIKDDNTSTSVTLHKIKLKAGTRVWQCFHNREEVINARYPSAQWNDDSVYAINSDERPIRWCWGYNKDEAPYDVYNRGEIIDHPHDNIDLRIFVDKQRVLNSSFTIKDSLVNLNVGSFKSYTKKVKTMDISNAGKIKLTYDYDTELWKEKHHHYFLENKLEFLNSQNEWFYDTSTNYFYVRLFNDASPTDTNIRLKTQSYVLNITSDDVTINNINFFGTTFKAKQAHRLLISNCNFLYPSCYAHMLEEINAGTTMTSTTNEVFNMMTKIESSRDSKIYQCSFKYTDGSVVETSGSSNTNPNSIDDCYFNYIDKTCANLSSVMTSLRMGGTGNIIKNNTIHKSGASSTINPGNQAIIEYNNLYNSGYLQSDGAMIHCMVAQQENVKIRNNYVHDTIKYGIRFDGEGDGHSGYIHHNIGKKCEGGIMVKGGQIDSSTGDSVGGHFVFNNTMFDSVVKNDIIVLNNQNNQTINHESVVINNLSTKLSGHRSDLEKFESRIEHSNNYSEDGETEITDINTIMTNLSTDDFRVTDSDNKIIGKALKTHANTYINTNLTDDIGALVDGQTPFSTGITWNPGFKSANVYVEFNRLSFVTQSKNKIIEGTMIYKNISGGFWGLISNYGEKYLLNQDLSDSLKVNGKKVKLEVTLLNNMVSLYMWGDYNVNIIRIVYDVVIVGGGPAGIMAAYNLANNKNKRVLLLEKNINTLSDYKTDTYDNIFNWHSAQNDSKYQYAFQSTDSKTVWMGQGLGGGTLHFGLQYIDTDDLINYNFSEWKDVDGENIIDSVNNITNAKSHTYNTQNANWNALKNYIDTNQATTNVKCYNNKIYTNSIVDSASSGSAMYPNGRLLLGDLIINNDLIDIKYGITIKNVEFNNNKATGVSDFNGVTYGADSVLMCAGAVQTPAILQRSGISQSDGCGNTLYDHAGATFLYGKVTGQTTTTTTTSAYSGDETFTLNTTNIGKINTHSSRNVYYATGGGVSLNDKNKIYDFTSWKNSHPGGSAAILRADSRDWELRYPHSTSRWNSYKSNFTEVDGKKLNDTINYNDLPLNLKSTELYNSLFPAQTVTETTTTYTPVSDIGLEPDKIIPHLQTRDSNFKWQTYYSTVPSLKNYLILTYAQSTNLSDNGTITKKSDNNENPVVSLNHGSPSSSTTLPQDLLDAYTKNNAIMTANGYTLLNPNPATTTIDEAYFQSASDSIYHYHGTCKNLVDAQQRVNGKTNLFIGDISVLSKPWGGSTSFPSLVTGYIASKYI